MALCDQASSAIMDYFLREDGYSAWLNNEDNLGITFIKSSRYDKTGHPEFAEVKPSMIQQWLALQSELRVLLEQQYQLLNRYQSYAEVPAAGQSSAVAIRGTIQSNIGWLEQAQNEFKTFRGTYCKFNGTYIAEGGSMEPMIVYGCMASVTRDHIKRLKTLLEFAF